MVLVHTIVHRYDLMEEKVKYIAPGNQKKRKITHKIECEESSLSQSPLTVGQVMLS